MALRRFRYVSSKCSIIFYFYLFLSLIFGWIFFDLIIFNDDQRRKSLGFFNLFKFDTIENDNPLEKLFVVNLSTTKSDLKFSPTNESCNFWTCFNVYRCGFYERKLTVYVYPYDRYTNENGQDLTSASVEYGQILKTIKSSRFYVNDSQAACLFVPSVDTLNLKNNLNNSLRIKRTGQILSLLPSWYDGENHLIFNFFSSDSIPRDLSNGTDPGFGRAILALGDYGRRKFRRTFDVAIPIINSISQKFYNYSSHNVVETSLRSWLLVSTQIDVNSSQKNFLRKLAADKKARIIFLDRCHESIGSWNKRCDDHGNVYDYPKVLESAQFCLILENSRFNSIEFSDALMTGCVPVVISDSFILPFSEVIDWKRAALVLHRRQLSSITSILIDDVTVGRARSMQIQGMKIWRQHFRSPSTVAITTLEILESRIIPEKARSYEEWNLIDEPDLYRPPLFLSRKAPDLGFTAVILTYDRIPSLYKAIQQLAAVKSLSKIIVVWNNPSKPPPHSSKWPSIGKPIKIVKTSINKLTNRFLPFDNIETESVLSLDDDITMLNGDELEFAYQVWREYPSYLVGFPSRVHTVDPANHGFVYNSEWTNNISMILTGAAFYHKYYNYLFTTKLSITLKNYVDQVMNCEDILMNFLIANVSGQPALKVTPRKKFRASEYGGRDLSTDSGHLKQRTDCLNKFETEFGGITIKTVEFRLDPVLFKIDEAPDSVLSYKNVGTL